MSLLANIASAMLGPKLDELKRELETGNYANAAWLVREIREQYPVASTFIEGAFNGTPAEAIEAARPFAPWLGELPNAEAVVRELQAALRREWNRPR